MAEPLLKQIMLLMAVVCGGILAGWLLWETVRGLFQKNFGPLVICVIIAIIYFTWPLTYVLACLLILFLVTAALGMPFMGPGWALSQTKGAKAKKPTQPPNAQVGTFRTGSFFVII